MSDSESLLSDVEVAAVRATESLLPKKSRSKYEKAYNQFLTWCDDKKATISLKKNVDISKYVQIIAFLKIKSESYQPVTSKSFTRNDIEKFLKEADNKQFLLMKVALIIETAGACRKNELTKLLIENVTEEGAQFHVRLPNTKTEILREFCVTSGGIEGVNLVEMMRSFLPLRPPHTPHGRFFVFFF